MDENELNELMKSGDLDKIDALLDSLDKDPEGLVIVDVPKITATATVEPAGKVETTGTTPATDSTDANKTAVAQTATEQVAAPATTDDSKKPEDAAGVATKDGKHVIPYEVLEHTRQQNTELQKEIQQLRAAQQHVQQDRDKLQGVLDKHGIKLDANHVEDVDPEILKQLKDDFPMVGSVIDKLYARIDALTQQQSAVKQTVVSQKTQEADPAADQMMVAFKSIPELTQWQTSDRDRMDFAVMTDQRLMADPAWKDKPVIERFQETVRRTKIAFGDEVPAATQQPAAPQAPSSPVQSQSKTAEKTDKLPNSPSDIGSAVRETATQGTPEYYASMSQGELQRAMAKMSPAELDRLLGSIDM